MHESAEFADSPDSNLPKPLGDGPLTDGSTPDELIDWLENQPKEVVQRLFTTFAASHYSGPLPPPNLLSEYNEIVPGSAGTIINQFVSQGEHRREIEKAVIYSDIKRANWGLVAGFVIAFVGVVGSLFVMFAGESLAVAGLIAFVSSLATIVVAFIGANRRRREERSRKDEAMPE